MHAFLVDADRWPNRRHGASLTNWINELKDLASEAEDMLGKYALKATKKKGHSLVEMIKRFFRICHKCYSTHQVGTELKDIRSRFAQLMERLKTMYAVEGPSRTVAADEQSGRKQYAHEFEPHFIEREDIGRLVSELVRDDPRSRSLISICGMGGLGKTTLARKIYNNANVQRCFQSRAWVCVTQQFQGRTTLRELAKQVLGLEDKEPINSMEEGELVGQIHGTLTQKKCLVFIDDIWTPQNWDFLKPAFPENCKIILTTRRAKLVSEEFVHNLNFLTEDQGWELLQKIAIANADPPPALEHEFEKTGREIVRKCGFLPLAISIIGGILRHRQTLSDWKEVRGNLPSYLRHGEGAEDNERIAKVLELSYNSLPYYLKPCFLYMVCFPHGQGINVENLYLLWMAEGLISSYDKGENETLGEVGQRYLSELAFRCLVQVEMDDIFTPYNKFRQCRLHDLIHDLCLLKASNEGFLRLVTCRSDIPSIGTCLRRVAICGDGTANRIQNLQGLISFSIFNTNVSLNEPTIQFQNNMIDFEMSKRLKILVFDHCHFEDEGELPNEIRKLVHLRYLSVSNCLFNQLPFFVCQLPYLQILDLRCYTVMHITLPNCIYKMKRLRHLFLNGIRVIGEQELKLEGLEELETLDCEGTEMICFSDIPTLTNLHKLNIDITDMENLSIIVDHLSNNQNKLDITVLRVSKCDFISSEGKDVFRNLLLSQSLTGLSVEECLISSGLPQYEQGMCERLTFLGFSDCTIGGDVMEIVGKYTALKHLHLCDAQLDRKMICRANSFTQLKSLYLECMPDLNKWEVERAALPNLFSLKLINCHDMEMLPEGLRFISTLQELRGRMPTEFNNRLRVVKGEEGEDYKKFRHIPIIDLDDKDDPEDDETSE